MTTALQGITAGILIGGIYAVVAIGLTLLLGVVRIVNFAHGAFVMAAAYVAVVLFRDVGIDPYVSVFLVTPVFFLVGVVYYLLLLNRFVGESLLTQSLFTIGIALILVNGGLALFGPESQVISLSYGLSTVEIGDVTIEVTRLVACLAGLATTAALYFLLWRTDLGVQVRASAADPATAELMGIRTRAVQATATGISIACAAIGGVMLLPVLFVSPGTGDQFTFLAFVIIVLGGLGNFWGALAGGMLIGLAQTLGATYFDGSMAHALTFVLFVVLVVLRPHGLFARRQA